MNGVLPTCNQATCADTHSVTSLQESQDGQKRCGEQELMQTDLFGQVLVHARRSVAQENSKVSKIQEIYGRTSFGSSASADLNESLASRLKQRLDTVGSTVYRQTWNRKVTPLGRVYWAHTARAQTTSDNGCTGLGAWVTPQVKDFRSGQESRWLEKRHAVSLNDQAMTLSGWKTPHTSDGEGGVMEIRPGCDGHYKLRDQAALAGWASPSFRDYKDTPGMSQTGTNPDGSERSRLDQLPRQTALVTSGPTPNQSGAETGSTGALNPAFSRWLQSFLVVWDTAAILAYRRMQTTRRKRVSCV